MTTDLTDAGSRARLAALYRATLIEDIIPFWLKHGLDAEHGGILTALDRDGAVIDTDKSVWFQGRAGWMFATLYNTVERRAEWLAGARSCVEFSRRHCFAPDGKMYFTVTREGHPLRMRRYVFSESFAAISYAAYAEAAGDARAADESVKAFAAYLRHSFTPGVMPPKTEPTRPAKSIGPLMIGLGTAQELRANLGDVIVSGRTCTEWIDASIAEIERDFLKPEHQALLEIVAPDGAIIDHAEGRTLNPGHALECAWFILHEGAMRRDRRLVELGAMILDWMWARGWDLEHGGLALLHRPARSPGRGVLARHEILVAARRGHPGDPAGVAVDGRAAVRPETPVGARLEFCALPRSGPRGMVWLSSPRWERLLACQGHDVERPVPSAAHVVAVRPAPVTARHGGN